MLPKKVCDSLTCLQDLVGVRSECQNQDCYLFYVENIEGFDLKRMAEITNINSPSAVEHAKDIINSSSQEFLGDIEMMINDGYSMHETFGDFCSNTDFSTIYVAGGGLKIKSNVWSDYSILRISKLNLLTNFTGDATLIIDDGVDAKTFQITLAAGVVLPITLDYQTQQRSANVFLSDASILVNQITVPQSSGGCGCNGRSVNTAAIGTVIFSGIVSGVETTTTHYGFKACASVSCSTDLLTCELINKMPRIFALTLFYKIASKYYNLMRLSDRNNRTAAMDDEKKIDMFDQYNVLYQQRLRGTKTSKGISTVVGKYLQQRRDKCVTCLTPSRTGWAVG